MISPPLLTVYDALFRFNPDPFWASTRALTLRWATSLEWPRPTLELGGQNGFVSRMSGRVIDLMVDIKTSDLISPSPYVQVKQGDAQDLHIPDCSFRSVVALNMIYHTDRDKVLRECWRVLKGGGLLIVTDTPGYEEILTWPYLLRSMSQPELAKRATEQEEQLLGVNIAPLDFYGNGFYLKDMRPYASLTLCRTARAWQALHDSPLSALMPQVPGIKQRAAELAKAADRAQNPLTVDKEYMMTDEAMCAGEGGVFKLWVLGKT